MSYIKKKLNMNKGFTLIEMLVAVFIFSVALAALMGISARGLRAARLAQNQVIADYLAIEGVEVVRNIRDSAFLLGSNTNTWSNIFNEDGCLQGIENGGATHCVFELSSSSTDISLYPCSGGNSCDLYFNETIGDYRHFQNGTPTANYALFNYDREIRLEQVSGSQDEIIVTVDVIWPTGSVQYSESLLLWF